MAAPGKSVEPWNHNIAYFPFIEKVASSRPRASERYPEPEGLRFVAGDLLTVSLPDAPFDLVACSATLRHVDLTAGLARQAELTAQGGTLVIVGLARNRSALDWALSALSILPVRAARAGWDRER
jgi:hypothetical protein